MLLLKTAATSPANGQPASNWLPAMLLAAGLVILLVLWTTSMRGRASKRNTTYTSPREQIDRIKSGHRTRDAEQALSAEFVTSATELAARLENKAERLEQLIEQADRRIEQLSRVVHESSQISSPRSPAGSAAPSDVSPPDPLSREICELADAGHSPVEIAQQLDEQVGKVELILALRRQ